MMHYDAIYPDWVYSDDEDDNKDDSEQVENNLENDEDKCKKEDVNRDNT